MLFVVSCTNNFEEYVSLPVKETNFQTKKIEELELEIPNHLKYTQLDIGDCEIFKDTIFDFNIITFQNLDTLFYSNAKSFYSIPKYPDSLYNFVSISYTKEFNKYHYDRFDKSFLNNIVNSINKRTSMEHYGFKFINLTYKVYEDFTLIFSEGYSLNNYNQVRYYFFDNRVYRIIYTVASNKEYTGYKKYEIEANKVLNSVRFHK